VAQYILIFGNKFEIVDFSVILNSHI